MLTVETKLVQHKGTGMLKHQAAGCMCSFSRLCVGTEAGSTQKALLALLRPGGTLAAAGAVIAYATFQAQTEQVAQFLTSHGIRAAAYHAGKHAKAWLFHLRALQGTAAADWLGHIL